jgi:hypothetical protein
MRQYQDMVYSTAARLLGDAAQAEDIAQGVFLKAYERFDELRSSPTAAGWLKTAATNQSLNHLSRYRKRWQFFSDRRSDDDDDGADPEFGVADGARIGCRAATTPDRVRTRLVPHISACRWCVPGNAVPGHRERLQVSVADQDRYPSRRAALAQLLTARRGGRGPAIAGEHGIA